MLFSSFAVCQKKNTKGKKTNNYLITSDGDIFLLFSPAHLNKILKGVLLTFMTVDSNMRSYYCDNSGHYWAVVVVAQLVERTLPTPEVRSSNLAFGKTYFECLLSTVLKREIYRKRDRKWPIFRIKQWKLPLC